MLTPMSPLLWSTVADQHLRFAITCSTQPAKADMTIFDLLTLLVAASAVVVAIASWNVARKSHRLAVDIVEASRRAEQTARRERVAEDVRAWAQRRWTQTEENAFGPLAADSTHSEWETDRALLSNELVTSGLSGAASLDAALSVLTSKNPALSEPGFSIYRRNITTLVNRLVQLWLTAPENTDFEAHAKQAVDEAAQNAWHRARFQTPTEGVSTDSETPPAP